MISPFLNGPKVSDNEINIAIIIGFIAIICFILIILFDIR